MIDRPAGGRPHRLAEPDRIEQQGARFQRHDGKDVFFLTGTDATLPIYIWGQLRFAAKLPGVLALPDSALDAARPQSAATGPLAAASTAASAQERIPWE